MLIILELKMAWGKLTLAQNIPKTHLKCCYNRCQVTSYGNCNIYREVGKRISPLCKAKADKNEHKFGNTILKQRHGSNVALLPCPTSIRNNTRNEAFMLCVRYGSSATFKQCKDLYF